MSGLRSLTRHKEYLVLKTQKYSSITLSITLTNSAEKYGLKRAKSNNKLKKSNLEDKIQEQLQDLSSFDLGMRAFKRFRRWWESSH